MPVVGDVYRVTLVGQAYGEPILNTWHYQIGTLGTGSPEGSLDAAFETNILTLLSAIQSPDMTYQQVIVQAVRPVAPTKAFVPVTTAGTLAGAGAPTQVAAIITRKSILAGRGGRGRLFIGVMPANAITADKLSASYLTGMNSLASAMTNVLTQGTWQWLPVIWRRKLQVANQIVTATSNPVVKTRRSRGLGTRFHRRKRRTVGSI